MLDQLLEIIKVFFGLLIKHFGPWGTIVIFGIIALGLFCWRYYSDRRRDKYVDKLLKEKDAAIQRLAEQERNYRVMFLKQMGWSDDDIDRFIMKNQFANPQEARQHLEGKKKPGKMKK